MRKISALIFFVFAFAAIGLPQQTGIVDTVAGGGPNNMPALSANLSARGLAVDSAGNLFVSSVNRVYRIGPDGTLTAYAGTGGIGWYYGGANCEGVPATSCGLYSPSGIAFDSAGNLYIADSQNLVVRRVDAISHTISRIAGNFQQGYSGDGGPATSAKLGGPTGIAIDSYGNIYIADQVNHCIRRINASTKIITTVAGNGTKGFSGDGGPAVSASLNSPKSVVLDAYGNLYIGDTSNLRIRRVDTSGIITTVAGGGPYPGPGDGGPATSAYLYTPYDITLDEAGNLFIAEYFRVRRVDIATGIITTAAGTGVPGYSGDGGAATAAKIKYVYCITADQNGNLFIGDQGTRIRRIDAQTQIINTIAGNGTSYYSGDGGPATNASLGMPAGTAVDQDGNLFIADDDNDRVRRVDAATHIITTVAGNGSYAPLGDGGPAIDAGISSPQCLAFDPAGDMYIGQSARIRKVDSVTGIITTVAGTGASGYSGDGGPATSAKLSTYFYGMATDASGNLLIADSGNNRVRRVDGATGIITTVAGNGLSGFSGDGGQAVYASLSSPRSVMVDAEGNLYICDSGNTRIRRVVAGSDGLVNGGTDEIITTVAGGGLSRSDGTPATSFYFLQAGSAAMDSGGNIYVTEGWVAMVFRVDAGADGMVTGEPDETVKNVAYSSTYLGFCGDGGPARGACYSIVNFTSADAFGNLYLSDWYNFRIRRVTLNQPPVAHAGPDKTLHVGEEAEFDGSSSYDPDGTISSCQWDFGDGATASGPTATYAYSARGTYTVTLTVADDDGASDTDTATVEVVNAPPIANAGPDQTIEGTGPTTPFTLNGSGSSDPDGDSITFEWKDGSGNVVSSAATVTLSQALGTYNFTLTVTDLDGLSSSDAISITIRDTTPPALTAPPDRTVDQSDPYGTAVTLGQPTVSDACDPSPTVVNNAPALFALGETVVTWTATDASGNVSTAQQKVTIVPGSPVNQLSNLTKLIQYSVAAGMIDPELETSLLTKVAAALDAIAKANQNAATVAMNDLKALVNQVEAQADKKITPAIAAQIIAWANGVIASLGG